MAAWNVVSHCILLHAVFDFGDSHVFAAFIPFAAGQFGLEDTLVVPVVAVFAPSCISCWPSGNVPTSATRKLADLLVQELTFISPLNQSTDALPLLEPS